MPARTRLEPCEILRQHNIPCLLWLEDAIANYNVPTCVSDVFLLVINPEIAGGILECAGWTDVDTTEARSCGFLIQSRSISHRCLRPPGTVGKDKTRQWPPPPPSYDPPLPTTTVLLSATEYGVSIDPLSSDSLLVGNFVPPLAILVDGLISGVLDATSESQLESRLALQLVYLYGYCNDMRLPALVHELRFENRQFHIDALTGPSVGKSKLLSWNRQVRREILEGTRQLMNENSLLRVNPSEYQLLISSFRTEFRSLSSCS